MHDKGFMNIYASKSTLFFSICLLSLLIASRISEGAKLIYMEPRKEKTPNTQRIGGPYDYSA